MCRVPEPGGYGPPPNLTGCQETMADLLGDSPTVQYQVLARKWRPRHFAEMVGQEHVLRALTNALNTGRIHHAFLFTGTRGVGKTTLARILAKSLNCETGVSAQPCGQCTTCIAIDEGRYVDLIEVDAASRTKVEDTRDLLDNVQYAPTRGRYKVYLIDEVHMLSNHSFNALLKTLEEPPPHVKFLFATTDPQKLPVTILSRCLQFNLKRLYPDLIRSHLAKVLQQEGIQFDELAIKRLAKAADGSMRDALSLLDQAIAYGAGKITDEEVRDMLGTIEQTHIYDILDSLAAREPSRLQAAMTKLAERSPDYAEVLGELLTCLHHLAVLQQIPDAYDEAMGEKDRLTSLQQSLQPEDVQLFYQIGVIGRRDLPFSPSPTLGFEMTVLRMLAFVLDKGQEVNRVQSTAPTAAPAASRPTVTTPNSSPPAKTTLSTPSSIPNITAEAQQWAKLVNDLKISGMVREMAMHSILHAMDDAHIQLTLDNGCKNLLNEERRSNLQSALQQHLGKSIKLTITLGEVKSSTPASQQLRQQQERLATAQAAIAGDSNVQKMVEAFGAQIRNETIQPTD